MNTADMIVIAVLCVLALVGLKRGLILSVFSLGSYFLAIILAINLAKPVSELLKKTRLFSNIRTKVSEFIDGAISGFVNDTVETQIDGIVSSLNFSRSMQEKMDIQGIKDGAATTSAAVESLSFRITDLILLVIAFVLVYIVAKIALHFISKILKETSKLPVIRSFDKLGGVIFGVLEAVLMIWIIFMVMFMFRASDFMKPVFDQINSSLIASALYKNNLLLMLVSNYLAGLTL